MACSAMDEPSSGTRIFLNMSLPLFDVRTLLGGRRSRSRDAAPRRCGKPCRAVGETDHQVATLLGLGGVIFKVIVIVAGMTVPTPPRYRCPHRDQFSRRRTTMHSPFGP